MFFRRQTNFGGGPRGIFRGVAKNRVLRRQDFWDDSFTRPSQISSVYLQNSRRYTHRRVPVRTITDFAYYTRVTNCDKHRFGRVRWTRYTIAVSGFLSSAWAPRCVERETILAVVETVTDLTHCTARQGRLNSSEWSRFVGIPEIGLIASKCSNGLRE